MKHFIRMIAVCVGIALIASASEAETKRKKADLKDITLIGTIEKTETQKGTRNIVSYVLTTEDGVKVSLPKPKAKDKDKSFNLDDCTDVKVKLAGKGLERTKGKNKKITIKTIVAIEEINAASEEKDIPEDNDDMDI